ncbi:MAG: hypothetical protein Q8R82_09020 [Hyphomonadaceae bacterium]|nr:hypothetical protein [Hyphomonadaceae bacterium]
MATPSGAAAATEKIERAREMLSKLMGDVIEPRREFIHEFALEAAVDA